MRKSKHEATAAGRRARLDRVALKQRLMSTSTHMFASRGFEGVPLREITRAAGASLPVVYWFFADKRQLYKACCLHALDVSLQQIAASAADDQNGDPRSVLLKTMTTLCELHLSGGGTKLLHRLLLDNDTEILAAMLPTLRDSSAFKTIKKAVRALNRSARSELETFTLIASFAGVIEHLRLVRLTKIGASDFATSRQIATFVLSMLFRSENWADTDTA